MTEAARRARWQTIVDLLADLPTPAGLVSEGRILWLNDAAHAAVGDVVDRALEQLVLPADRSRVAEALRVSARGRQTVEVQLLADGRAPFDSLLSLKTDSADPQLVHLACQDMSAQRRSESALESMGAGLSGHMGEAFLERLVAELASRVEADAAFVAEFDAPAHDSARSLALWQDGAAAPGFHYELAGTPCANVAAGEVCVHASGVSETFPHDELAREQQVEAYAGMPLTDGAGEAMGLIVVLSRRPFAHPAFVSRTLRAFAGRAAAELERVRSEQALRRSEERYRAVVEGSREGIIMHGAGRLLFANPAVARIFGYDSVDELLAVGELTPFIAPHERERVLGMAYARYRGEWAAEEYEFDGLRKDGSGIRVRVSAARVDWDGVAATHVVLTDVTQRHEAEAQRRHAQKMESLGELTGGIAHDFNNVLAVMLGNLELLDSQLEVDAPQKRPVAHALQAGERATEMTQRLLAFARRREVQPALVELSEVLGEARVLIEQALSPSIELAVEQAATRMLRIDPGQLQTALLNLAINARDAMSDRGRLGILSADLEATEAASVLARGLDPDAGWVRIAVTDSGEGMTPEVLERAFDPFYTTKSAGRGTGLGLSMIQGFVEESGGCVRAESEPGVGTRIALYLPAAEAPPAAESTADAPHETAASVTGARILIVEDQEPVRQVAASMLQALGYVVDEAADGEAALEALQRRSLDIVLCDVVLPGLRGPEVALRAKDLQPNIAVVFMSGYAESAVLSRAADVSDADLIRKPFRLETLRDRVGAALAARSGAA